LSFTLVVADFFFLVFRAKSNMFESVQSKVLLALAFPVIFLSQKEQFSMTTLLTQLIIYISLAYNADCLVTGRCKLWAWGSILFPLIQTIGYLFFNNNLDLNTPVRLPIPRSFTRKPTAISVDEK
jgi:hypothetical protein